MALAARPASATSARLKPPWRIWSFAAELQVRLLLQRDRAALGRWMTARMSDLGPAFIKGGQFLSTRSDVLGKEVTDELAKLQDNTNVVAFERIAEAVRAELGCATDAIFESIEPLPLASASIGQVHRAKLRTKRGAAREVAIKVRKPGVRDQIYADLGTLKAIAGALSLVGAQPAREMDPLLVEYERFLTAELDYTAELAHMQRFADFFAAADDAVRIPRTYPSVSSSGLLVMEYLPSTKVTDAAALDALGVDKDALAGRVLAVFVKQVTQLGSVHADPHPGNVGVLPDGRTLVLYDFGNVVRFSEAFVKEINAVMVAIVERDVDEFVKLMTRLGLFVVGDAMDALELKAFFKVFFQYLQNTDFDELRGAIVANDAMRQSRPAVKIDNNFFALFRVFSLLDGTCTQLSPSFNYIEVLAPFALNALRDPNFLDYRIRRDVARANGTSAIEATDATQQMVVSLNARVKAMASSAAAFRAVLYATMLLNLLTLAGHR